MLELERERENKSKSTFNQNTTRVAFKLNQEEKLKEEKGVCIGGLTSQKRKVPLAFVCYRKREKSHVHKQEKRKAQKKETEKHARVDSLFIRFSRISRISPNKVRMETNDQISTNDKTNAVT